MPSATDPLLPLLPTDQPLSPTFTVLLVVHILAGLTGVVMGAGAASRREY